MSRDRPSLGTAATSRRRFLRGVAGLSLGATSLGALAACQARPARPASKRLPLIASFSPNNEESSRANGAALRDGLAALGYHEGRTVHVEWRYADGDPSRWSDLARELVALRPDVIAMPALPLKNVLAYTRSIPIVTVAPLAAVEDLIGSGFIKSQAHPGANVTGMVGTAPTIWSKRLDLLKEAVPAATRVGVLRNPQALDPLASPPAWVGKVVPMPVSQPADLEAAFAAGEQNQVDVLAVAAGGNFDVLITEIAERARRMGIPAVGDLDIFASVGGLLSYAADQAALYRNVGRFVDKILKGATPADLPVELPTTFKFIINKATADAIGLSIPPAVLAQATEVLQ